MSHFLYIALLALGGTGLLLTTGAFVLMTVFPEIVYPSNDIEPEDENYAARDGG